MASSLRGNGVHLEMRAPEPAWGTADISLRGSGWHLCHWALDVIWCEDRGERWSLWGWWCIFISLALGMCVHLQRVLSADLFPFFSYWKSIAQSPMSMPPWVTDTACDMFQWFLPLRFSVKRMKSSQVGLAESPPFWTSRWCSAPPESERPKGGEVVGSILSSLRCIAFI